MLSSSSWRLSLILDGSAAGISNGGARELAVYRLFTSVIARLHGAHSLNLRFRIWETPWTIRVLASDLSDPGRPAPTGEGHQQLCA
jgi:hypothetical protein